jgi:hypothetical protein
MQIQLINLYKQIDFLYIGTEKELNYLEFKILKFIPKALTYLQLKEKIKSNLEVKEQLMALVIQLIKLNYIKEYLLTPNKLNLMLLIHKINKSLINNNNLILLNKLMKMVLNQKIMLNLMSQRTMLIILILKNLILEENME